MQIGTSLQYGLLKARALLLLACVKRPAALATFDQMLRLRPEDPYALASRAHVAAQLQLTQEAIASLRQLTAVRPGHAAGWFNLGYVLQQAGHHEEAGPAFERAVGLDARLDQAWYGLALVHVEARRFEEAAQALQKNTALQPLSPYGWYRLAQVWLALGQPGKARKVIAHLRRFEPRVAAQFERENEAAFAGAGGEAHAAH
ncbi:tetratricopeptide repeat protein [Polaromonas sp. YR568]|uniref:tetratricopeptide repeat protein n=1 Tax=Polaromonas sp. YR568 TaxID=1855301 RepID=UPI0020C9351B|nr:tetratricopeptide repeat protein [Polaromonas sp. YR568]